MIKYLKLGNILRIFISIAIYSNANKNPAKGIHLVQGLIPVLTVAVDVTMDSLSTQLHNHIISHYSFLC